MEANYTALTGFIRNTLIKPPLKEEAIQPGMGLMYAESLPVGLIGVKLGQVKSSFPMIAYGYEVFNCNQVTGENGTYELGVNQRLEVMYALASTSRSISDMKRSIKSKNYFHVRYKDRIFAFQFNNYYSDTIENAERIHESTGSGLVMITRGDPDRIRLFTPGSRLTRDANTLELIIDSETDRIVDDGKLVERLMWRVVQRIPDGPEGYFDQLGYREFDVEELKRIVGNTNIREMLDYNLFHALIKIHQN